MSLPILKLEGARDYQAKAEHLFSVLTDPAQFAERVPGVERFEVESERRWSARVRVPFGVGGPLRVRFVKLEERPARSARLLATGEGLGAIVTVDTAFHLESRAGAQTAMSWHAVIQVGGPLARLGQRVIQPLVKRQIAEVLAAVAQQVEFAGG